MVGRTALQCFAKASPERAYRFESCIIRQFKDRSGQWCLSGLNPEQRYSVALRSSILRWSPSIGNKFVTYAGKYNGHWTVVKVNDTSRREENRSRDNERT